MIIAFNGNRHQEKHLKEIQALVDAFIARDCTVVMSDRFLDYMAGQLGERFRLGITPARLDRPVFADLAIAIGGDGAFLKTAAWVGDSGTPVAGINTGHLGFLAAFGFDRPDDINRYLLTGEFTTQGRTLLQVDAPGQPSRYALNEVAILRGDNASMVTVDTTINSYHSLTYKGDGLIIATPTGSTAYNLSVGGPILDPCTSAWVISPIAAHSLSLRPLVIRDDSTVDAHVTLRSTHFRLSIDGRNYSIPADTTLRLVKAPFRVNVVTLPGHPFTDTLANKLGLG